MYKIRHNRELTPHLLAKAWNLNLAIVDLQGATRYIEQYGRASVHWNAAAIAIERADSNPALIGVATEALKIALEADGLLAGIK